MAFLLILKLEYYHHKSPIKNGASMKNFFFYFQFFIFISLFSFRFWQNKKENLIYTFHDCFSFLFALFFLRYQCCKKVRLRFCIVEYWKYASHGIWKYGFFLLKSFHLYAISFLIVSILRNFCILFYPSLILIAVHYVVWWVEIFLSYGKLLIQKKRRY